MTTQSIVYLTPSAISSPNIASTSGISNIRPPSMRETRSLMSSKPRHISQVPVSGNAVEVNALLGGFHVRLRLKGHMIITDLLMAITDALIFLVGVGAEIVMTERTYG